MKAWTVELLCFATEYAILSISCCWINMHKPYTVLRTIMMKRSGILNIVFPLTLMLCVTCLTCASILYIAKDNNYFNTLYAYFRITPQMHSTFMYMPVDKATLLRCINLSAVAYYYSCLYYPLKLNGGKNRRKYMAAVLPVFLFELLSFDPGVVAWLYLSNNWISSDPRFFRSIYQTLDVVFRIFNYGCLVGGFGLLLHAYLSSPKLKAIRLNLAALMIAIVTLNGIFIYIFGWAPTQRLWISKVAHYISYQSLQMVKPSEFFPYYYLISLAMLLVICVAVVRFYQMKARIRSQDWEFNRTVDVSQTTARVLCHYMKNQVLAIKAELEAMEPEADERMVARIKAIEEICDCSYQRLRQTHALVGKRRITLSLVNFRSLMEDIARGYAGAQHATVSFSLPQQEIAVFCDATLLHEAVCNIINNGLQAMEGCAGGQNRVDVVCTLRHRWVSIEIHDNGPGIQQETLPHIFEPFYSTKPVTTNWGMGLALAKRIVLMHQGKIDVTSGDGTTFTVYLPYTQ